MFALGFGRFPQWTDPDMCTYSRGKEDSCSNLKLLVCKLWAGLCMNQIISAIQQMESGNYYDFGIDVQYILVSIY